MNITTYILIFLAVEAIINTGLLIYMVAHSLRPREVNIKYENNLGEDNISKMIEPLIKKALKTEA